MKPVFSGCAYRPLLPTGWRVTGGLDPPGWDETGLLALPDPPDVPCLLTGRLLPVLPLLLPPCGGRLALLLLPLLFFGGCDISPTLVNLALEYSCGMLRAIRSAGQWQFVTYSRWSVKRVIGDRGQ